MQVGCRSQIIDDVNLMRIQSINLLLALCKRSKMSVSLISDEIVDEMNPPSHQIEAPCSNGSSSNNIIVLSFSKMNSVTFFPLAFFGCNMNFYSTLKFCKFV